LVVVIVVVKVLACIDERIHSSFHFQSSPLIVHTAHVHCPCVVEERKLDKEIEEHLPKACSDKEEAPKMKHIRFVIIGTHTEKGAKILWKHLRNVPISRNPVQCWKALLCVWKVLQDGHPSVLVEFRSYMPNLRQVADYWKTQKTPYSTLISAAVDFIARKLHFHEQFPEIPGNMALPTWRTVSQKINLQTARALCNACFDLLDFSTTLSRLIFSVLSPNDQLERNECRASVFVPLIHEAVSLHEMSLDLMRFLFTMSSSSEFLGALPQRFRETYLGTRQIFFDARNLKYLETLVAIPALSEQVPNFERPPEYADVRPREEPKPPRPQSFSAKFDDFGNMPSSFAFEPAAPAPPDTRDQQIAELKSEIERLRARITELEAQAASDADFTRTLQEQLFELQSQASDVAATQTTAAESLAAARKQAEEAQTAAKTAEDKFQKAMAMYQKLRSDHLAVLKQKSELEATASSAGQAAAVLKAKQDELAALEARHASVTAELHQQLADLRRSVTDTSDALTKAREEIVALQSAAQTASAVEAEKSSLEEELSRTRHSVTSFQHQLAAEQAKVHDAVEQARVRRHSERVSRNQSWLRQILGIITSAAAQLQDAAVTGASGLGAPYVADLLQTLKSQTGVCSAATSAAVVAGVQHGEGSILHEQESISTLSTLLVFATGLREAVLAGKGLKPLSTDETFVAELQASLEAVCHNAQPLLQSAVNAAGALQVLSDAALATFQTSLDRVLGNLQHLMPKTLAGTESLEDAVRREMEMAMKAVDDAARRIAEMMQRNESNTGLKLDVNKAILGAARQLMDAIRVLVDSARYVQNEIVAQGRDSASATEFYKKNSRWTDGLLSAAKAVGFGAGLLVQSADECVSGEAKFEEIIVASREISASTAQLVTASRVKSIPNSTNQAQLEKASKEVSEATKSLVAAAKSASQRVAEEAVASKMTDKLTPHQAKRMEMDLQVKVLQLEAEMHRTRQLLLDLRAKNYHSSGDVGNESSA
jgi:huntingtin interacting protein 1